MKKFKILHIPTALYVWEYDDEDLHKGVTCVNDSNGSDSIFLCCGKTALKRYLSDQLSMKVTADSSAIVFYDRPTSFCTDPVILHEFEIIEVTE